MSVYRDSTGQWRFRKWVQLPSLARKRISGTPENNTKVAAEAAERLAIDRIFHPERFPVESAATSTTPTVEVFSVRFQAEYKPFSKWNEKQSKKYALSGALIPFFGALRLDEIDQGHVDGFIVSQQSKGLAPKTINNRLTILKTMLKWAHALDLIGESKLRCHIDIPKPEMRSVPLADVAKLLAATIDARLIVAVRLASEAGLRVGEILGAQWNDIKAGVLTVRRAIDPAGHVDTPKHSKVRSVPLSLTLIAALEKLPRRGLWILAGADGEAATYTEMRDAVNTLYRTSGVDVPKSDTGRTAPWHSLRHTFGTVCAAKGVPIPTIMKLMGHTDAESCLGYIDVNADQLAEAIARTFGQVVAN